MKEPVKRGGQKSTYCCAARSVYYETWGAITQSSYQ
jgi:hypothetical protein